MKPIVIFTTLAACMLAIFGSLDVHFHRYAAATLMFALMFVEIGLGISLSRQD